MAVRALPSGVGLRNCARVHVTGIAQPDRENFTGVLKTNDQHQGTQLPWTPRPVGLLGHPESSLSVPISSGPAFGGLC